MQAQPNAKQNLPRELRDLRAKALTLAGRHRDLEAELCAVLRDVDRTRLYKKLEFPSLFQYATIELGFSAAVAYAFISVARKSAIVPELKAAIESKSLSVAKASRIVSGLDRKTAASLIEFAQRHSCRETEVEMARLNPKSRKRDRLQPLAEDLHSLQGTVSERVRVKLKRAESLMAQKGQPTDLNSVLEAALDEFLKHHDPVQKAERAQARKAGKATGRTEHAQAMPQTNAKQTSRAPMHSERSNTVGAMASNQVEIPHAAAPDPNEKPTQSKSLRTVRAGSPQGKAQRRIPLTATQRHAVFLRDQGRCTHVDAKGERCGSDRWIDVHHIQSISCGGDNEPSNLTVLCSFHHDLVHQLTLTLNEGEVNWLRAPRATYR